MLLELLDEVFSDDLAEVYIGRLTVHGTPRLVTVRKLMGQAAAAPGVPDELRKSSEVTADIVHDNLTGHLAFANAGEIQLWLDARTDGYDLEQVLSRAASSDLQRRPLNALQIAIDALAGLGALHDHGQVHGSPGPLNLLVGFDGVTRLDASGFDGALLGIRALQDRARRGKAGHLAPEVVRGGSSTPQSDVYAIATVIYTMLTGMTPLEASRTSEVVSTRRFNIPPPSRLNRNLPFSYDAVFLKALHPVPDNRHENAGAFHKAVKRLRSSVQRGMDEGRDGVKRFLENLFPEEVGMAGRPGTIERPALMTGFDLQPLGQEGGPPAPAEDDADTRVEVPAATSRATTAETRVEGVFKPKPGEQAENSDDVSTIVLPLRDQVVRQLIRQYKPQPVDAASLPSFLPDPAGEVDTQEQSAPVGHDMMLDTVEDLEVTEKKQQPPKPPKAPSRVAHKVGRSRPDMGPAETTGKQPAREPDGLRRDQLLHWIALMVLLGGTILVLYLLDVP